MSRICLMVVLALVVCVQFDTRGLSISNSTTQAAAQARGGSCAFVSIGGMCLDPSATNAKYCSELECFHQVGTFPLIGYVDRWACLKTDNKHQNLYYWLTCYTVTDPLFGMTHFPYSYCEELLIDEDGLHEYYQTGHCYRMFYCNTSPCSGDFSSSVRYCEWDGLKEEEELFAGRMNLEPFYFQEALGGECDIYPQLASLKLKKVPLASVLPSFK